ncbi:MAG: hypothetical protein EZS28_041880, partial [Streblomastix strix]
MKNKRIQKAPQRQPSREALRASNYRDHPEAGAEKAYVSLLKSTTLAVPEKRDQHQSATTTTTVPLSQLENEQQTQIKPKLLHHSPVAIEEEEDIQTPLSPISQPIRSKSSTTSSQSSYHNDLDQQSADVTMGAKESAINKKLIEAKKVFAKKQEKNKKASQKRLATPARTPIERSITTKRSQRNTSQAAFALPKAGTQPPPPASTQNSLMEKQLPGEVEYQVIEEEEEDEEQQLSKSVAVTNKQSSDSDYVDDEESSSDQEEQKQRKYKSAQRELNNLQKGRASQQLNEKLRAQSTQRK